MPSYFAGNVHMLCREKGKMQIYTMDNTTSGELTCATRTRILAKVNNQDHRQMWSSRAIIFVPRDDDAIVVSLPLACLFLLQWQVSKQVNQNSIHRVESYRDERWVLNG